MLFLVSRGIGTTELPKAGNYSRDPETQARSPIG